MLALVNDGRCSAYDCEFVALAMSLDVPLFTMDRALLRKFPRYAQTLPNVLR